MSTSTTTACASMPSSSSSSWRTFSLVSDQNGEDVCREVSDRLTFQTREKRSKLCRANLSPVLSFGKASDNR